MNKINWTGEMLSFLECNYQAMTNKQLADTLGLKLSSVRAKLYALGFKRIEPEYWTDIQVGFLKENYGLMGDVEIAECFNQIFHKNKGWTQKHIGKKRRYLNLKRTPAQIRAIKHRNVEQGRYSINHYKRWEGLEAEIGTVRVWKLNGRLTPFIKVAKKAGLDNFKKLSHHNYELAYGDVIPGYNVTHIDGDPLNCNIENLKCISNAELSRKNIGGLNNDNWIAGIMTYNNPEIRELIISDHPELIELKREQLKLKRELKNAAAIQKEAV